MSFLDLVRMFGALALVLGGLAGALWAVRRYDLKLPLHMSGGDRASRRLELIERLPIDQKRAVALIRRDGAEHLILLAPEGNMVVESAANPNGHRAFSDLLPRAESAEPALG